MDNKTRGFSFFNLPGRLTEVEDKVAELEQEAGEAVAWADISGKPTTFLPTIGTTSTTAKAGNYTPSVADIPALPTSKITSGTFAIAQLPTGTSASTVALGNHNHAITTDAASGLSAAANLQALAVALSARIKALEDAAV